MKENRLLLFLRRFFRVETWEVLRSLEQIWRCCWTLIWQCWRVHLSSLTFTLSAVAAQGLGVRTELAGVLLGRTGMSLKYPLTPFSSPLGPEDLERCRMGGHLWGPSLGLTSLAWASDSVATPDQTQTMLSCSSCLGILGMLRHIYYTCSWSTLSISSLTHTSWCTIPKKLNIYIY